MKYHLWWRTVYVFMLTYFCTLESDNPKLIIIVQHKYILKVLRVVSCAVVNVLLDYEVFSIASDNLLLLIVSNWDRAMHYAWRLHSLVCDRDGTAVGAVVVLWPPCTIRFLDCWFHPLRIRCISSRPCNIHILTHTLPTLRSRFFRWSCSNLLTNCICEKNYQRTQKNLFFYYQISWFKYLYV